jgi:hypothetical protein
VVSLRRVSFLLPERVAAGMDADHHAARPEVEDVRPRLFADRARLRLGIIEDHAHLPLLRGRGGPLNDMGMLGRVPAAISSRILARSSASITGSTTSRTRVPEVACPTRTSVEGGAALVQVRLVVVLAERPQKAQAPDAAAAGHSG